MPKLVLGKYDVNRSGVNSYCSSKMNQDENTSRKPPSNQTTQNLRRNRSIGVFTENVIEPGEQIIIIEIIQRYYYFNYYKNNYTV